MIYDCFTFFNELDLLELRLETLANAVDKFVLVESTRTHTNKPKPLHFAESAGRFSRFRDRIIHVVVEDNPEDLDPWVRERHQRDCIMRGLSDCNPDDTILISDLDEIPDPKDIPAAARSSQIAVFEHRNCYYFLNSMNGYWYGTRAATYLTVRELSPNALRFAIGDVYSRSGWHFSFLGGVPKIVEKLQAFAHQEYNTPAIADPERVAAAVATGTDLFGRNSTRSRLVPLEEMPVPVQEHPERYTELMTPNIQINPEFHENWYHRGKIRSLLVSYRLVKELTGRVVEIGCWEGRSASTIARTAWPDNLDAVDTWAGSADELADHPTVTMAAQRNVFQIFLRNMHILTRGNFRTHRMKSVDYLKADRSPIKFCHLDASHDYHSVKAEIELALPLMVPGGILCGDDFENASIANTNPGMDGGVERAVRELLPEFHNEGNFWWWQAPPRSKDSRLGRSFARLRQRLSPRKLKRGLLDWMRTSMPSLHRRLQDWWWVKQARRRMKERAAEQAAKGTGS